MIHSALREVIEAEVCPPTHQDAYSILRDREIKLLDSTLSLTVLFAGGCRQHEFLLRYEKDDGDLVVTVCHNANGDLCEALVDEALQFHLARVMCDTHADGLRLRLEDGSELPLQ